MCRQLALVYYDLPVGRTLIYLYITLIYIYIGSTHRVQPFPHAHGPAALFVCQRQYLNLKRSKRAVPFWHRLRGGSSHGIRRNLPPSARPASRESPLIALLGPSRAQI